VTAEPDGDPVHRDGEWITTARVIVRMTDEEYQGIDGLQFEAFPWIRFRLKSCSITSPGTTIPVLLPPGNARL